MELVYADFPDDQDVAALCAEALMNLTPWKLWDLGSGLVSQGPAAVESAETISTDSGMGIARKRSTISGDQEDS
jgi:hypothetical protein